MNNQQYNKRILLSVTGMSPAVVTETLYALVVEKNFIPTEIQVITTIQGKDRLLATLLGNETRKGALQEFIEDYGSQYGIESIHFDENSIHIIENSEGEKLPDIRTPQENEFAADNIVKLVGNLCQDDETQLHVSIAGGRKTMGFFMGYALSLYGREQDSMSHVLVSEGYENIPEFNYPKPYSYIIKRKVRAVDGTENYEELDAKNGKVMLAEIPWVRLGLGVPSELLNNRISYSDSVSKAQQLLERPHLKFHSPIYSRKVNFGNKEIKLSHKGYSLLLSLIISKKKGWEYYSNDETMEIYSSIYEEIKNNLNEFEKRLKINSEIERQEEFAKILSESREDIRKKVMEAFSIGKSDTAYIPSSSYKRYELLIDLERIDLSEITQSLYELGY
ncbi:CRISPR-associated protein [Pasteurellaceae bacterium LFhippo2]|nr:CRISPR-associated protein [Pasteurellaceae bacterium LFhippo2]